MLVTDNGTEFVNKLLVQVAEEYRILHTTVPPYHAQANPVECAKRTLKQIIIACLDSDHRLRNEHLPEFRYAMNTAEQSSTKRSPDYLYFGRELKLPNTIERDESNSVPVEKMCPRAMEESLIEIACNA